MEAPPVPGRSGLHASRSILDALPYAKSTTLCRVRLSGRIVEVEGQLAATERVVLASLDAREPLRELTQKWIARSLSSAGVEPSTLEAHREGARAERARVIALEGEIRDAEWSIAEGAGRRSAEARAVAEGKIGGAKRALAEARSRAFTHEAAISLADGTIRGLVQAIDLVTRGIAVAEGGDREEVIEKVRAELDRETSRALLERLPPADSRPPRARPVVATLQSGGVARERSDSVLSAYDETIARVRAYAGDAAMLFPIEISGAPDDALIPLRVDVASRLRAHYALRAIDWDSTLRSIGIAAVVVWGGHPLDIEEGHFVVSARLRPFAGSPELISELCAARGRQGILGPPADAQRLRFALAALPGVLAVVKDLSLGLVIHLRDERDVDAALCLAEQSAATATAVWGNPLTALAEERVRQLEPKRMSPDLLSALLSAVPFYRRGSGLLDPRLSSVRAWSSQSPNRSRIDLAALFAQEARILRAHALPLAAQSQLAAVTLVVDARAAPMSLIETLPNEGLAWAVVFEGKHHASATSPMLGAQSELPIAMSLGSRPIWSRGDKALTLDLASASVALAQEPSVVAAARMQAPAGEGTLLVVLCASEPSSMLVQDLRAALDPVWEGAIVLWGNEPVATLLACGNQLSLGAVPTLTRGWLSGQLAVLIEHALLDTPCFRRLSEPLARSSPVRQHLVSKFSLPVSNASAQCPRCGAQYWLAANTPLASTVCGLCESVGLTGDELAYVSFTPSDCECPHCHAIFSARIGEPVQHARCPVCAHAVRPIPR